MELKYLLIALAIDANGDASGLWPPTWYDDPQACETRGEEFRDFVITKGQPPAREAYFDCVALTAMEIAIMSEMIPYKLPQLPRERENESSAVPNSGP